MNFLEILKIIADAGSNLETIRIFYPATINSLEGWREVEPYSIKTTSGKKGEKLIYKSDSINPENIFYGYSIDSNDNHCDAFVIGKIIDVQKTGNKFSPRNNWDVGF